MYKRLFVDSLYHNVTELFLRKNCRIVYSGKIMHQKKANAGRLCKIWFVPFVPWLPSSRRNHDGKRVFYDYHIYIYIYIERERERERERVRMPDKSSNVPSSIVYSAIGAESLRIARASNNPELFSTVVKFIACMIKQGLSINS